MGLLVFVRNLLLALCLFLVLGFLYYSAWKLHLLQWEEDSSKYSHSSSSQEKPVSDSVVLSFDSAGQALGSEYDRLGFLLNLDSKLPAELATKYANFSEGACKPGYASALMTAIFPRFSKPAPMFLDDSFRKWARIREFVPPFGIKGQDNLIKAILSVTKEYRLTPALDSLRCRRCIIVGNGGVLANKSLGSRIDDYDIVVRLNSAPVKGFEKDVGSKTTLRITYPEGAMQRPEQYERDSLFVLAGFKWQDFKWLKYIVYKERVVHSRTVDGESQERQQQGKWEHRRADRREGRLLPVPQLLQIGSQGSCAAGSSHWPRSPLRPQQHTHSIPRPVPAPQAPSYPPLLHTGAPPHTLFTIIPLVPVTHPISSNTDGLPTPQALGSPLNALCSRLTVPTWGSLPLP
ncbi:CMP-N-acetylneuraminate-beta-1,4-galactoside alpha-2,3-sialyltransferase isoform X1 [Macaca fascicularis]|uniref:CMP-N-acetylneuraminate-beta-1,4-galactoside alpha-2,3-sialyltransferase isoform X1 n=1 Tax=Macaca fascicularis TaxID=9541 RepID=UPI0032B02D6B